jgi:hypothetical protein
LLCGLKIEAVLLLGDADAELGGEFVASDIDLKINHKPPFHWLALLE